MERTLEQDAGAATCPEDALSSNEAAFEAILPLLQHGGLDGREPALVPGLLARLRRSFQRKGVAEFVKDASCIARADLAIRNAGMRLCSADTLTSLFIPPRAGEVVPALRHLLSLAHPARDSAAIAIAVRLFLVYQILLTIHPFRDGNGRTARMFFAAKLAHANLLSPIAILALALVYRDGGHRYHQASWLLRAGDPFPMVTLYVDSLTFAHASFAHVVHSTAGHDGASFFQAHCWKRLRSMS